MVLFFPLALYSFPTLLPQMEQFTVISPEDGVLYSTGSVAALNLSLRYALTGQRGASRICLQLLRGSLHVYRGPLLRRDVSSFSPYAKGCFSVSQPVTFQNLVAGNYALYAAAQNDAQDILVNASTVFFGVDDGTRPGATPDRPPEFEPTYEWKDVLPGQSVPSGLEVHLALGENHRLARIPSTWRLQLYLGHQFGGFFRMDVRRDTLVSDIETAALAQMLRSRRSAQLEEGEHGQERCAALFVGSERLPPSENVEQVALFQRRGNLKVDSRPCPSTLNLFTITRAPDLKGSEPMYANATTTSTNQLALRAST